MKIIFDIGSNNGDDIPYYLHIADKVIAIEANPKLCEVISKRFKTEIQNKRLFIENSAISDLNQKTIDFYINKKHHVKSSIFAPKCFNNWEKVIVKAITCKELLKKYGEPYYIKIDIEGADKIFLEQLLESKFKPRFISAECHKLEIFSILSEKLEYKSFKLVEGHKVNKIYKKKKLFSKSANKIINYSFPKHSAGPFGNDINGDWVDKDSLLRLLALKRLGWKDIHATTDNEAKELSLLQFFLETNLITLKEVLKFFFLKIKKPLKK